VTSTKSWLYHLTKGQLVRELEWLSMDGESRVTELRFRMSCFVTEHPEYIFGSTKKTDTVDSDMYLSGDHKKLTTEPEAI